LTVYFERSRPDIVVHLAAVAGRDRSQPRNPGRIFYDNANDGLLLIEPLGGIRSQNSWLREQFVRIPIHTCPIHEDDLGTVPEEQMLPTGLAKDAVGAVGRPIGSNMGSMQSRFSRVNLMDPDNFDSNSSHVIPALIRKVLKAQAANTGYVDCLGNGNVSQNSCSSEMLPRNRASHNPV